MRLNFSGRHYESCCYGVDPVTGLIDMDAVRAKAQEFRPRVLIGGWSAYPRIVDFAAFRDIADEVGAHLWVDMAHFAGGQPQRCAERSAAADVTSGLRIGTSAPATRGLGDAEFTACADVIATASAHAADAPEVRARVSRLVLEFRLHEGLEDRELQGR
jgi:glycine/serine hydroxymethyltransferase